MDYFLTEEQRMIKDLARQIAEEHVKPVRAELDETGEFPWEIMKILAQADMFRVFIPEEYGGLGTGALELCLVVEELSVSASVFLQPMLQMLWEHILFFFLELKNRRKNICPI